MLETLRQFFSPPVFEDEGLNRRVRFLNTILLYAIGSSLFTGVFLSLAFLDAPSLQLRLIVFGTVAVSVLGWVVLKLRQVFLSQTIFLALIFLAVVAISAISEGLLNTASVGYGVFILAAGLLIGIRAGYVATVLSALSATTLYTLDVSGAYVFPSQDEPFLSNLGLMIALLAAGLVVLWAATTFEAQAVKELQQANLEIAQAQQRLAARVSQRARNLQLVFDISRRLSQLLNVTELSREVVNTLQATFGYYHVHLYLLGADGQTLQLVAGSGEIGQQLLARQHHIPAGSTGLVRRAASTQQPVLVDDVALDSGWLPNPLLPNTRTEVAVPVLAGARVLGVLDVQNDKENTLTQDDVDVLVAIAAQIATVLTNARRYEELATRARFEALTNSAVAQVQQARDLPGALASAAQSVASAVGARHAVAQIDIQHVVGAPNRTPGGRE